MEIVAAAKAAAAEIVVFPEMYSNGYECFDPNDPAAEAARGIIKPPNDEALRSYGR
jgi:predicted amidohydrolase